MNKLILLTGATGYIGSHTAVALASAGYDVLAVDNLLNSRAESLTYAQQLSKGRVTFCRVDLRSEELGAVLENRRPTAVLHLAASKDPMGDGDEVTGLHRDDIEATRNVCSLMEKVDCRRLVFASSAAVYAPSSAGLVNEQSPLGPSNTYGRSKVAIEALLREKTVADNDWQITVLRYFNVAGAHPTGEIGESPVNGEFGLVGCIAEVAVGRRPRLDVYARNDLTPGDGTPVRDYVHVFDVANANVRALASLGSKPCLQTYNIGTGRGTTVLEMVSSFGDTCGKRIPFSRRPPRSWDLPVSVNGSSKAQHESEILATLYPGRYTAIVSGQMDSNGNPTSGVALIEAYNLH